MPPDTDKHSIQHLRRYPHTITQLFLIKQHKRYGTTPNRVVFHQRDPQRNKYTGLQVSPWCLHHCLPSLRPLHTIHDPNVHALHLYQARSRKVHHHCQAKYSTSVHLLLLENWTSSPSNPLPILKTEIRFVQCFCRPNSATSSLPLHHPIHASTSKLAACCVEF